MDGFANTPLWEVLWRRRWAPVLTVLAFLAGAYLYLTLATPIYRASASLVVQENGPKVLGQNADFSPKSDTFLQTQVDIIQSSPVLSRALAAVDYRSLRTLAKVGDDPIEGLRQVTGLRLEAGRKSDVIVISLQSPYAAEAVTLVDAIVKAFLGEVSQQRQTTGKEMLAVLERERRTLEQKRDVCLQAMQAHRKNSGVSSFHDDKGNTVLERAAELSRSLTAAQLAALELQSQYDAVKTAVADPTSLSSYVAAQQFKNKDAGDREYEELRSELTQAITGLDGSRPQLGDNHRRVQTLQALVDTLTQRLRVKERAIADAQLIGLAVELTAAQAKERQLRAAVAAQQTQVIDLSKGAAEYGTLEADLAEIQRQCELVDNRIAEVSTNNDKAGPLKVQVIEPAVADTSPVWPNRMLVLAAAVLAGGVIGMGLGLLREARDPRLRSVEQVQGLLGRPVLGAIPRISHRISQAARAQVVRLDPQSPAAEAYRCLRSSLDLGAARKSRAILLVSPSAGDGKSTTASNLAIAFAEAGYRTLLIDGDLRDPVQHLVFGIDGAPDLASVLAQPLQINSVGCQVSVPGLYVLPCARLAANPAELLGSSRFDDLLQDLRREFDRIIIDSPPLMNVTDGRILATLADATLLVLRMNHSIRHLAVRAVEEMEQVGANIVGVVANDAPLAYGFARTMPGTPATPVNRLGSDEWRRRSAQLPPSRSVETPPKKVGLLDEYVESDELP